MAKRRLNGTAPTKFCADSFDTPGFLHRFFFQHQPQIWISWISLRKGQLLATLFETGARFAENLPFHFDLFVWKNGVNYFFSRTWWRYARGTPLDFLRQPLAVDRLGLWVPFEDHFFTFFMAYVKKIESYGFSSPRHKRVSRRVSFSLLFFVRARVSKCTDVTGSAGSLANSLKSYCQFSGLFLLLWSPIYVE